MTARRACPGLPLAFAAALLGAAGPSSAARGAEPVEAALTVPAEAQSRLVLDHWPSAGWLVRQSGRLVELALPSARIAISTEAVTLPAAGGAVTELSSEITDEGTVLRVGLGCDCTLAVRGDGGRLLIDTVGAGRDARPLNRDDGPAPRLARAPRPRPSGDDVAGASGEREPDLASEIDETRSRLLGQLQRAAEAGLVKLRPGRDGLLAALRERLSIGDRPAGAEEGVSGPGAGFDGPGPTVDRAAAPVRPVRADYDGPQSLPGAVTTQRARPAALRSVPEPSPTEVRDALVARAPAPDCIASERFVLPDPLPPRAFIDEVGRLRRALLGEFDRPDPSVALELARLYLGHGLGAEAHQVLAEFARGEPEAPLLAAMSRLSEGRPLPRPHLLGLPDCGGQHALWQALDAALDGRSGQATALLNAADGALEQVTHGLRGRVAARLGLAAAEARDWIAAHRLEAMAKRALAPSDRTGQEMAALLSALVLRERGDVAEARRRLAGLAEARSPAGAEALLILAESVGSGDGEATLPFGQLRLDLGALARAHRGKSLGVRAFRAEVVATGRLMGRDAAFDLADHGRETGLIEEADYRKILAEIGGLEGRIGDTPLAILYENEPERFTRLRSDGDFRMALVRSYLSLGAPMLAERVTRPEDLADESLRRALAAAYLEVGDRAAARRLAPQRDAGLAHSGGQAGADPMNAESGRFGDVAERAGGAWASGDWRAAVEALRAGASAQPPAPASRDAADGRESGRKRNAEAAKLALRLAFAAKRAGLEAPPPEALELARDRPAIEAGIRALFGESVQAGAPPPPEALAGVLARVSDEIRMYREVVEDG